MVTRGGVPSTSLTVAFGLLLSGCGQQQHATPDGGTWGDASTVDGADGIDGSPDGPAACAAPGSLDMSFGSGGVIEPLFGHGTGKAVVATGVAIDSMSRIVVAGGFTSGARSCVLARILPDGSRDTTFGINGVVRQSIEQHVCWYNELAIQADDKIVALGEIDGHTAPRAILARYKPDGTLDLQFGDQGIVLYDQATITSGLALAIDANQRIVAVGAAVDNNIATYDTRRFLPDGTVDASFGSAGIAEPAFMNGGDAAFDVAIQSDGKILVVGEAGSQAEPLTFGIVRYKDDGTRDPDFGSMGSASIAFDLYAGATGIALDSTDRPIVVGGTMGTTPPGNGALARLNVDGGLDTSFGTSGKVVDSSHPGVYFASVATTSQDRVLAVGSSSSSSLALARYTVDGEADPAFGSGGFAQPLPLTWRQTGWDVAVQADGRIVVVGGYGDQSGFDMLVARYCP